MLGVGFRAINMAILQAFALLYSCQPQRQYQTALSAHLYHGNWSSLSQLSFKKLIRDVLNHELASRDSHASVVHL
jgi:hypothetical protein